MFIKKYYFVRIGNINPEWIWYSLIIFENGSIEKDKKKLFHLKTALSQKVIQSALFCLTVEKASVGEINLKGI